MFHYFLHVKDGQPYMTVATSVMAEGRRINWCVEESGSVALLLSMAAAAIGARGASR